MCRTAKRRPTSESPHHPHGHVPHSQAPSHQREGMGGLRVCPQEASQALLDSRWEVAYTIIQECSERCKEDVHPWSGE